LLGFIAAKAAVEWADQSDAVRKAEVIEDLARMYGEEARDYIDYVEKNWAYEPYNGGCPCFNVVTSGVMKGIKKSLHRLHKTEIRLNFNFYEKKISLEQPENRL